MRVPPTTPDRVAGHPPPPLMVWVYSIESQIGNAGEENLACGVTIYTAEAAQASAASWF